ncbi:hypothetical protein [Roseateles amylovorans]|uniref:DUF1330 domain-containing protein n=1 Tax=Roseateles amylovorans TaxID=2978473 RepID=A0ABY6AYV2_9BURK|nr:hypothetical protein [Roseateles amylovorans]UXH78361.1 hypothetical protein N4261_26000 [Roseateles amylovorans]
MVIGMAGQASAFENDVAVYLQELPKLLSQDEGKFALIGEAQLVSVHESEQQALTDGYERFGQHGFLVQQISGQDLEMAMHWHQACPF